MDEDRTWVNHFIGYTSDFEGYVNSQEQLDTLLKAYELKTDTHFIITRNRDNYAGKILEDSKYRAMKIQWSDQKYGVRPVIPSDDIPFVCLGSRTMQCHFRKDCRQLLKRKMLMEFPDGLVEKQQRRSSERKSSCPSTIRIRHVLKFPEYKDVSAELKSLAIKYLREKFGQEESRNLLLTESRFYVNLPTLSTHKDHIEKKKVIPLKSSESRGGNLEDEECIFAIKEDTLDENDCCNLEICNESQSIPDNLDLSLPFIDNIQRAEILGQNFREVLGKLEHLSYFCHDPDVLEKYVDIVNKMKESFEQKCAIMPDDITINGEFDYL